MKLDNVRVLRGPNRWHNRPVLEIDLELEPSDKSVAPSIAQQLERAFSPLHVSPVPTLTTVSPEGCFEYAVRSLLQQAGAGGDFSRTFTSAKPTRPKVIVAHREEIVGRAAADLAHSLLEKISRGQSFELSPLVENLRLLDEEYRLGPSTGSIVRAAEARGIPATRLNSGSLVRLGQGARQRRILAAEIDETSTISENIAQDKELTKALLSAIGVPVPQGRPVKDAADAWAAAREIGGPVVVKPQYGNQGRGVAVNLTGQAAVEAAFEAAKQEGSSILVESYCPGFDHRLLVVGGKLIAAARRDPPHVRGDGVRTVKELVAEANRDPRRGEDHATALSKLRLDDIATAVLAEQGLRPESVPSKGSTVLLRRNGNLSTGGSATDVTDRVHPEVAARAVEAARMVGLHIAGVDVVCLDPSVPLEEQQGAIVEVNAAPGLRMHLEPTEGSPRPVGESIVDLMFRAGETGRVPVVAVTGTNGKTTTTQLMGHLFASKGLCVGMTTTEGIYVAGQRIDTGDCSGPRSARLVLSHPLVEAAVLETARGGILREGLGFDVCDVAIVTNLGEGDHLGLNGITSIRELAAIKRVVVENVAASGYAVLNAADPLTVDMSAHCPGKVIYFARDAQEPVVAAHREAGGRAVVVKDSWVLLTEGVHEIPLVSLHDVPLTLGGRIGFQVENVLSATAAAWGAAIPFDVIRRGLQSFVAEPSVVPARFNVLNFAGARIVVDYAHNVDACRAVIDALSEMPAECARSCSRRRVTAATRTSSVKPSCSETPSTPSYSTRTPATAAAPRAKSSRCCVAAWSEDTASRRCVKFGGSSPQSSWHCARSRPVTCS
jgi:cyanophycin synthetase